MKIMGHNKKKKIKDSCLLCTDSTSDFFYSELNLNLYKCRRCGLVYVYPPPNKEEYIKNLEINYIELANRYNKTADSKKESERYRIKQRKTWEKQRRKVYGKTLNATKKYLKRSIKAKELSLLDVGCGEGYFILEAQKRGFLCEGLEPSKKHYPKRELGLKVFNGFLKEFRPSKKYDVIAILDSLEHCKDPLEELRQIRKMIKKEGILIIRVPNLRWLIIKENLFGIISFFMKKSISRINPQGVYAPHTHLCSFSEKSISKLFDLSGFDIKGIEIINASGGQNLLKNMFYIAYHILARVIFVISDVNLAISLNIFAKPK